jgi:Septum formation initiator
MADSEEITALKEEIRMLRSEMESIKEFVKAMYGMIGDDEDYDSSEYSGNAGMGRFNT